MNDEEVISKAMSILGKRTSERKAQAARLNAKRRRKRKSRTERAKQWYKENGYSGLASTCKRNPENDKKTSAHYILNKAIREGTIKRQSCEICGVTRVHAHHDDYSQPLNVRWFCAKHHKREHAQRAS